MKMVCMTSSTELITKMVVSTQAPLNMLFFYSATVVGSPLEGSVPFLIPEYHCLEQDVCYSTVCKLLMC